MSTFKIGVFERNLRLPRREALEKAKEIGLDGIQLHTTAGDEALNKLSSDQRKEVRRMCDDLGLELPCAFMQLGKPDFSDPEQSPRLLSERRKSVETLAEMGIPVLGAHIGPVPAAGPSHPRYGAMRDGLRAFADVCEDAGLIFAIETGPEKLEHLNAFIDAVDSPAVGINLDPANLVMVVRDDPVAGTRLVGKRIAHTHAKDGVNLKECDPEIVYGYAPKKVGEAGAHEVYFREVPLGEGDVDFPGWLGALRDVGYDGFLTIEREVGDDPERDIRHACRFLREQIAALG